MGSAIIGAAFLLSGAVCFAGIMIVKQLEVLERMFNRHQDDTVRDNERLRHTLQTALLELKHRKV